MTQPGLFDNLPPPEPPDIVFCDHRMDDDDKPRLSRQCRLILARLERGPASNQEMAEIALKYTGRISDLRKSGYDVRMIRQNHKSGQTWYGLFIKGEMIHA